MHLTFLNVPLLLLAGALTGVAGAMLGTGGGVFLIPALVLGAGLPIHQAIATSILSVIATSSAVASTNVERGTANMRLGMTLEIATTLGAISGAMLAPYLSPRLLEGVFALVLVPTATLLFRGRTESAPAAKSGAVQQSESDPNSETVAQEPSQVVHESSAAASETGALGGTRYTDAGRTVVYRVQRLWGGLMISFMAGNLSGLLGIGGGVFKAPALNLVCGVPMKAAAATSNFMIGVTAAASASLYYGHGDVRPTITAVVVLGVLLGSALGSVFNRKVHDRTVQIVFAALLLAVAGQMMWRAIQGGA